MPITINATDPTIEVEETDEDQVVDVSIKPKGLYIDEKVEEDIVEDDGGGDDEKTKKPKKTKETNKIIKKLENGFDISIEEAELLKGAGYSYYQPTADDATTEGKIDLYEKITNLRAEQGGDVQVDDEGEMISTEDVLASRPGQGSYTNTQYVKRFKVNQQLEDLRLEMGANLNVDNWSKSELAIEGAERPRILVFDKDGNPVGGKGKRQNFDILSDAINVSLNEVGEGLSIADFKAKHGVELEEALGIPPEVIEEFDKDWAEKIKVDPANGQLRNDAYKKLITQYQIGPEFDNVRVLKNKFDGAEMRTNDLTDTYIKGVMEDVQYSGLPALPGGYESSIKPYIYSGGSYISYNTETLLSTAINNQTRDALEAVEQYLPTKTITDEHRNSFEVKFDVGYAMDMRKQLSQTTNKEELLNLKNKWLDYVSDFGFGDIDEGTELLINPKTGDLWNREQIDGGGEGIPNISQVTTIEDYIQANFRFNDIGAIEQNIVDKEYEITAQAQSLLNSDLKDELHKIKGWAGIARELFGMDVKGEEGLETTAKKGRISAENLVELPEELAKINPEVANYNQLIRQLKVLSKAYYTNLNPLTFEEDMTFDGITGAANKFFGSDATTPNEEKRLFADMFQRDFPAMWNKFTPEQVDEFYEDGAWRKFGGGLFEFGIIAAEFAATRKIGMGTINRIVNGFSTYNKAKGAWEVSGGVRGFYTGLMGTNTGSVGRGYVNLGCTISEEYLVVEGRNILAQTVAPYETDRMHGSFAVGLGLVSHFGKTFPRLLSHPNLTKNNPKLAQNLQGIRNYQYRLRNNTPTFYGYGIPTSTLESSA